MLSEDSRKFIESLHPDGKVEIFSYDPKSQEVFEEIKRLIQSKLGETAQVEHEGSSGLEIAGQDEIDVAVVVAPDEFEQTIVKLTELFGEPSRRKSDRSSFIYMNKEGKRIDLSVFNKESPTWEEQAMLKNYLKTHPDALAEYRRLKEPGAHEAQDYYTKKSEFLEKSLEEARKEKEEI